MEKRCDFENSHNPIFIFTFFFKETECFQLGFLKKRFVFKNVSSTRQQPFQLEHLNGKMQRGNRSLEEREKKDHSFSEVAVASLHFTVQMLKLERLLPR
jgi:hypothetical protein